MTFGESIRFHRLKNNMSQKALADVLFVTPQSISKWENDLSQPDFEIINALTKVFKVSFDTLFKGHSDISYEGVLYTAMKDSKLRVYYQGIIYFFSFLILALMFTTVYIYTTELPIVYFNGFLGINVLLTFYLITLFKWKLTIDQNPEALFDIYNHKIILHKDKKEIEMHHVETIKVERYTIKNGIRIFENTGIVSIQLISGKKILVRDVLDIKDIQVIFDKIKKI